MITLLYHEADRPLAAALDVLRLLSRHRLLEEVGLVEVPSLATSSLASEPPEQSPARGPGAAAVAAGGEPLVVTAVATAALDPAGLRELAGAANGYVEDRRRLTGAAVSGVRLYLCADRQEHWAADAEEYFSPETANLVAVPVDSAPSGVDAEGVVLADADRFAWHAALEIATVTSGWRATAARRPWWPEPVVTGVGESAVRFVRSWARFVVVVDEPLTADSEGVLPVAAGFRRALVPTRIARAVEPLLPPEFRLEPEPDESPGAAQRGIVTESLALALRTLFPVLAGSWRGLRASLAREWAGDIAGEPAVTRRHRRADEPEPGSVSGGLPAVLAGFDLQTWTDLVQDVLGVIDGADTRRARDGRRAAGHERTVFVDEASLVDDVLERELGGLSLAGSAEPDAGGGPAGRPTVPAGADPPPLEPERVEPAGAQPDERRRGLLTLLDDAFREQISRARQRHTEKQTDLDDLNAEEERIGPVEPPRAARSTAASFLATTLVVVASYVLLLDFFDFGDASPARRTVLAVVVTAFTWLVLAVPLAPHGDDDPTKVQSYLIRASAAIAVVAALASVFVEDIASAATGSPWLELVPLGFTGVTAWLCWKAVSSANARQRPVTRSLALAWTSVNLLVMLFLYANMERSLFGPGKALGVFFARYGGSLRAAAIGVAVFLLLLALALLAVTRGKHLRDLADIAARRRELRRDLDRRELEPQLEALRINWLGTAAALDHILRVLRQGWGHPAPEASIPESLIARLAARVRGVRQQAEPGWLFARYKAAAAAYTAAIGVDEPPEASSQVSEPTPDLLRDPSGDPRWDFARRLRAGEFDEYLIAPRRTPRPALLEDDVAFLEGILPVDSRSLPFGTLGPGAARLGNVGVESILWWPADALPPAAADVRPAEVVGAPGRSVFQSACLDVSEPVRLADLQVAEHGHPLPEDGEGPLPVGDDGLR